MNFVKQVRADGKSYFGTEVHNLVEMIMAEEYGGLGGLWWNTVKEEEGLFVQYSQQGNRLFYRERPGSFSAASGYRGNNNNIHIFAASVNGVSFEFNAIDRPVYFNGNGPRNRFTITLAPNEQRYIEVTFDPPENPAPTPTPVPSADFGLEYVDDNSAILYHLDQGWSANFQFLCLNNECLPGELVNGRYQRLLTGLSLNQSYMVEFKVQDDTAVSGQCLTGNMTVSFQRSGSTLSSPCVN